LTTDIAAVQLAVMANETSEHHWRPRVEDDALVRGAGRFAADSPEPGQAFGYFVRSPHAFAKIRSINVDAALRSPGVFTVVTAADMEAAGIADIAVVLPLKDRSGKMMPIPPRPSLAGARVLHVGQPIALVVADSLPRAQDAAELVEIDFEELPAVADVRDAVKAGAPQLWPEAPGNVAVDWIAPEADGASAHAEVDRIFAGAHKIARVEVVHQRICGMPMEPRGATASYDQESDRYQLRSSTQGVAPIHESLVKIMGVKPEQIRVIAADVGGAFGIKTPVYPEYPALLVAAKKLGRPVHWMSSRAEAFMSDNQARDAISEAETRTRQGRPFPRTSHSAPR
jgi:aerobic carbon-monoxide dehydrogenase large subunit